jgi:hypothetical protein
MRNACIAMRLNNYCCASALVTFSLESSTLGISVPFFLCWTQIGVVSHVVRLLVVHGADEICGC